MVLAAFVVCGRGTAGCGKSMSVRGAVGSPISTGTPMCLHYSFSEAMFWFELPGVWLHILL